MNFLLPILDQVLFPLSFKRNLHRLPVESYALIQDSGGAGKFRGGLGVERILIPMSHDSRLIAAFERQKNTKPWGLFGGKDGRVNLLKIHKKDGRVEDHEKVTDFLVRSGEKVQYLTGGGGGYGDPLDRDPSKVLSDVENG